MYKWICLLTFVAAGLAHPYNIAKADSLSPEARCRAIHYQGSPVDKAIYDFCVEMLRNAERNRLRAKHHNIPLKFSNGHERLKPGQVCIAGTVVEIGKKNGVPYANQVLEDFRPLACQGYNRL